MDLIVTVVAEDRPGIVDSLAAVVARHDGNWVDARLASMAGMFAGIVRVEVAAATVPALRADLEALAAAGIRTSSVESVALPAEPGLTYEIAIVANDRPGVVAEVASALARVGVNVDELASGVESASMSGGTLFRATLRIALRAGQTIEAVRSALEAISPDVMIDVSESAGTAEPR